MTQFIRSVFRHREDLLISSRRMCQRKEPISTNIISENIYMRNVRAWIALEMFLIN